MSRGVRGALLDGPRASAVPREGEEYTDYRYALQDGVRRLYVLTVDPEAEEDRHVCGLLSGPDSDPDVYYCSLDLFPRIWREAG